MEFKALIFFIVFIGLIVYIGWVEKRNWKTIYESSGLRIGEAQAIYTYLQGNSVRCRLTTLAPKLAPGGGGMINPLQMTTERVEVHQKDLIKPSQRY